MKLKVLLVDDDKMAVFLQRIIIQESNFTEDINSFNNGFSALEHIKTDYREGDTFFLFLDVNMPMMNGWELLDAINKQPFANDVLVAMASASPFSTSPAADPYQYKQVLYTFEKPITTELCNELKALPQLAPFFRQNSVSPE